jgi:hypothetical protein
MDDSSKRRLHAADFHCLLCSLQNFMAHSSTALVFERAGREDGEKVEERKGERGRRERKASQRATIRSDRYIIHGTQNRRTTDEATGGGAANINSTAEAGTVTPHDTAAHASQHHKGRHSVQSRRKGKE